MSKFHDLGPLSPKDLQAEIVRLNASYAKLLGAAKKFCIQEDFDYPGDSPISCGFSCLVCGGDGQTETTIEHTPQCAIANAEKIS